MIACKLGKQDVHFGFYRAPRLQNKHDITFSSFLIPYISLKLGSLETPANHRNQIYASHGFIFFFFLFFFVFFFFFFLVFFLPLFWSSYSNKVRPSASSRFDHGSTLTASLRAFCSVIGELDGAILETADCIGDAQDKVCLPFFPSFGFMFSENVFWSHSLSPWNYLHPRDFSEVTLSITVSNISKGFLFHFIISYN